MHTIGFPPETVALFVTLAVGAFLFDTRSHEANVPISLSSAVRWSLIYVAMAFGFCGWLALHHGAHAATLFLTGYALEKVLSVDNLIVFSAIFSYYGIESRYQHRVLHYGIIGAIVFRLIFVAVGVQSLTLFGPVAEGFFGGIIAWTAIHMMIKGSDENVDHKSRWYIKLTKHICPVSPQSFGPSFFVKLSQGELGDSGVVCFPRSPTWHMTPLFLCLVTIEISDVLFSFDSVPAVIAVTQDPLIVYTAMLFAIFGLRSLYFVLEAMKKSLVHLEKAVFFVLLFIAAKLVLHAGIHLKISPLYSLMIVLGTLLLGVVASLVFPEKEPALGD